MADSAYFNKLHKRVELAVLVTVDWIDSEQMNRGLSSLSVKGAIGQDDSKGQHIVSLLSEVAETLNDAEGESLQGFKEIGTVVYGMAKTCHEHSAGMYYLDLLPDSPPERLHHRLTRRILRDVTGSDDDFGTC